MATVILRPNESQDQLLKRFRKKVAKSGILSTVRRKRWFVSKSELILALIRPEDHRCHINSPPFNFNNIIQKNV